ncbi:MAG: RtcB family protein [Opitutales bacterium]
MKIIGKYTSADIKCDTLDGFAEFQIQNVCNLELFKNSAIKIMPDCHAGKGCVIGFTANMKDKVIPNLVGMDIACSISTYNIGTKKVDFAKLDKVIRTRIPHGIGVRRKISELLSDSLKNDIIKLNKEIGDTDEIANRDLLSVGSLGSGNHFIELNKDSAGNLWFTIHCGSRNLGARLCKYYQSKAKRIKGVGKHLWYIEGEVLQNYIKHSLVANRFVKENHKVILSEVCEAMNWAVKDSIFTHHNYLDIEANNDIMIRKGAISARLGERVIIPLNMRDGSIIAVGKGNKDWNCSAPHGAGRLLSRTQAEKEITLEAFKKSMEGIWSTSVKKSTIDESPFVYKSISDIEKYLNETVDFIDRFLPVYNFKSS